MRCLAFDYETFSSVDIGKCGSYKYMESQDFEVLLLAYAFDNDPVKVVDLASGEPWPKDFLDGLSDPNVIKCGWNCAFEREATRQALGLYQPPEQYEDTMILAAQCGLPLSLAGAGDALGLGEDQAKMKEGKALIRYFCLPCKPTKTNGMRTRNLPEHAPEKWALFKEYNRRDVETERTIRNLLIRWKPLPVEHDFWALDARINERGVRIDRQLALNAVAMDLKNKEELTERAVAITGLDNPKSVSQVKNWLYDQEGKEFPSLNKKVIADVVSQLQSEKAREFMELRSELAKSSVAKYDAMVRAQCEDGTVKGCFLFYGASRTGRYAGRLVQFQNMSKNEMESLAEARSLVKGGHYTALKALYDGVAQPLSELVRTAIIPEDGHQLLVSDFSAIEARVLAWLAGEQWRLDVFLNGGDIYCQSASQAFKVPVVKHGINGHLRQKGKIMELACVAEGELVLTDKGLFPIVDVTPDMKVWDGEEWVSHEGVVYKGEREVIQYGGLTATPDHLVWIEGSPRPVRFEYAASRGARLLQTGDGRTPLRAGGDHQPGETMEREDEPLLRSDPVYGVRGNPMAEPGESEDREINGLSELLTATTALPTLAGSQADHSEAAMHESKRPGVSELRRSGNNLRLPICTSRVSVGDGESGTAGQADGVGPREQQSWLRAGKPSVGDAQGEQRKPAQHPNHRVAYGGLALQHQRCTEEAGAGDDPRGDSGRCVACSPGETEELAQHRKMVRVYDLLNAGPRHRFTVSGVLVHNCGYGGSIGAMKNFGADKLGMTDQEIQETVDLWRESSPNIVQMWWDIGKAAARSIVKKTHVETRYKGVCFDFESGILWMTLPSGRRIAYYSARCEESRRRPGKKVITYMGVDQKTKKWARLESYGPKLVENLTQGVARDCLREAMLALDAEGYDIRAHVHDEVIVTEPLGGRSVEEMSEIMGRPIPWAPGLPLRADGYSCPFYQKD